MGFKYAIRTERPHFLTHTVVDWVDLFTRRDLGMIVVDSLNYCVEKKGLEVYAWCLMPSHLHMIASVVPGNKAGLSDVMRDFKRFTSKMLFNGIDQEFESRRLWLQKHFEKGLNEHQVLKEGMHPIELYSGKFIIQKLNYIHMNPVAAGIVDEPEHYVFSSARDYMTKRKGLVEITYING
jgi:REP element-mobilizing transposase RayT